MSRRLVLGVALLVGARSAHADTPSFGAPDNVSPANTLAPSDMADQAIAAMVGVAGGGRTTPGGILVAGHYYYQLNDSDWFDGGLTFLFGSGEADCFRDRANAVICEHGLADGYGFKFEVTARRFLPTLASDTFWPFVRAGVGAGLVRFSDDDHTGITFSLIGGLGMRASVSEGIAVVAGADLDVGFGQFSNDLGMEPQLGVHISAGAEFKL